MTYSLLNLCNSLPNKTKKGTLKKQNFNFTQFEVVTISQLLNTNGYITQSRDQKVNNKSLIIQQGGVRAVVYTDVFQTLSMLFGVLVVVAVICVDFGGVDEIRRIGMEGGRLDMFKYLFFSIF